MKNIDFFCFAISTFAVLIGTRRSYALCVPRAISTFVMSIFVLLFNWMLISAIEPVEAHTIRVDINEVPLPTAADFAQYSFTDLDGHPFTFRRFHGQVLLVNFWATWCGPCAAEMPALERLAARYRGRGLTVLPISIDHGGSSIVAAFFTRHKLQVLRPWLDADDSASRIFHLSGVPVTYLLDAHGVPLKVFTGDQDWLSPDMLKIIDRALSRGADSQDGASAIRTNG